MTPLGNELSNLRDHMLHVAAVMRTTPDATDRHRRHAGELEGAAAICLEWIKNLKGLQNLDGTAIICGEGIEAMNRVVAAARCIRHWHDSGKDGMVVSGAHVRALWQALADLDGETDNVD